MKSGRAKVLHEVAGRPLVEHVVRAAFSAGAAPVVVVVGVQGEDVETRLRERLPGAPLVFVPQPERRGTADAVARARAVLPESDQDVLILCGDAPALSAATLAELLRAHRTSRASLTVLSAEMPDPTGYGRIVRGPGRRLAAIVEERDAAPRQRAIREINTGAYAARWSDLAPVLDAVRPDNTQNELYLTDAVRLLLRRRKRVGAVKCSSPAEALGVNSRRQLAEAGRVLLRAVLERLMDGGVTVLDPDATWVDDTVEVGPDTVLHPGVTLEGRTRIGAGCTIRSGVRLADVEVGDRTTILDHTVATSSVIGADCQVGPFSHLRPGAVLAERCKVGNFVEIKKSSLGAGTKASHLSYLGDATLGREVNVGAGTITCNYDGKTKNPTVLEDGVFVGSDAQLVAPVTVGRGAYVAAGTTVTKDVPSGALAISRVEQKNVEGWVERRKNKP